MSPAKINAVVSTRGAVNRQTARGLEGKRVDGSDAIVEDRAPRIYTVGALTQQISRILEDRFDFVWVEGEISNFRTPASGHYYLILKDETAQIRAVMFRPQCRYLKFTPEDGMKVLAQGRVGVYPPRGEYQIILDYLEPVGLGALALAFDQLKRRLAEQGVFDQEIKKPLPYLPQRMAVITSPTGAAIRDFLKVILRRFASIQIVILPVRVQGEGAASEMIAALETANRELDVDLIVLTRGGGSLEDLWAFNDEELALAIRRSRIPVVSAVGHEVDMTISDLAADLRAPTPSAAAELIVVEKEALKGRLLEIGRHLQSGMDTVLSVRKESLSRLAKGLRDPRKRLDDSWMRLDEIQGRMLRRMQHVITDKRHRLHAEGRVLLIQSPRQLILNFRERLLLHRRALAGAMTGLMKDRETALSILREKVRELSPLSVLKRGFSVTRKLPEKIILKDAKQAQKGDRVHILLSQGELECLVDKTVNGS